jgi:membrane glycosyltransferase
MPEPLTPAGLQSPAELARRRRFAALACSGVYLVLLAALAAILLSGPWRGIGALMLLCFAVSSPWHALGLFNAALGLRLLRAGDAGLRATAPFVSALDADAPLRARTALTLAIRNEAAARAFAGLRAMKARLDATPHAALFDYFVLSDASDPEIAAAEEAEFARWRAEEMPDAARIFYRRRSENKDYKAGNLRDFSERWGENYEFMIPLDADSRMDADAVLALLRIGEAFPKIGIVQSLVVGAPSQSAFARLFQFGMRAGMRSYTLGAAWWAGDCGPYWGHNALIRIAPFVEHCALPELPGAAPLLSHDQIEAALMRRAGFEVRVLPVETASFEENPPDLLAFLRRDLRWCEGNLQYPPLIFLPGLLPMSRFQLVWAVSMFIGAPAACVFLALGALLPHAAGLNGFPTVAAAAFYLSHLALQLAPKLAGYVDAAQAPGGCGRYGGAARFWTGALVEILAGFLIGGVTTLNTGAFVIARVFGRRIGWGVQQREAEALSWRAAAQALWPHTLFGLALLALAGAAAPPLFFWFLPLALGPAAAIPFAVATASPRLGRFFARAGLCAAPEEFEPPPILRRAAAGR